ncbi:hypothetical protein DHL47_04245 [Streptococcus panodentis]|uniref:Type VII secretion effector n=1 Tax=Streptococcus panodentis TaxID=1581472 RepID=A0ABS5AVH2_9STRE|nr:hypothetical protein [Streptococcus panodentis]
MKLLALESIKTLGKAALAEVQQEREAVKTNVSASAASWHQSVSQMTAGLDQMLAGQFSNQVKESALQKSGSIQELQDMCKL